VVFSYSRSQRKLMRLAREAQGHARAGTLREAILDADALLLAVHWSRVNAVLKQAGDLSGKVIVTCSLPMNANNTALVVAHTSSGAETLAMRVRQAHVVSTFSTVPSEVLFDVFRRKSKRRTPRRPSLLYCGDDRNAKKVAARLIRDVGFRPVDAGPLRVTRYLEPFSLAVDNSRTRATKDLRSRTASNVSGKLRRPPASPVRAGRSTRISRSSVSDRLPLL